MPWVAQNRGRCPVKLRTTPIIGGNVVSKQVFDGTKGYAEQQGNKMPFPEDEAKAKAAQTTLVEQVDYISNPAFKLEPKGVEKVNGNDAYKIQVTLPGGKVTTEYYAVNSKLLVKQESASTTNGMSINRTTEFSDYKKVGNLLFPYKNTLTIEAGGQQQVLDMVVTDIKLNEGVTADDFK